MSLEDTLLGILREYSATFPSVKAAAESLGATYETFRSWHDGVKSPTIKSLSPFIDAIQASGRIKTQLPVKPTPISTNGENGSVPIPVYAVAGAGAGFLPEQLEPLFTVTAPLDYFRRSNYAVVVSGHSMEPLIPHGSIVGVKTDEPFQANELFLANIPYEGLVVKRVGVDRQTEEFIFKSQNPDKEAYPDFRLSIHEADGIIMGRVVWVLVNY